MDTSSLSWVPNITNHEIHEQRDRMAEWISAANNKKKYNLHGLSMIWEQVGPLANQMFEHKKIEPGCRQGIQQGTQRSLLIPTSCQITIEPVLLTQWTEKAAKQTSHKPWATMESKQGIRIGTSHADPCSVKVVTGSPLLYTNRNKGWKGLHELYRYPVQYISPKAVPNKSLGKGLRESLDFQRYKVYKQHQ